MSSRVRYLVFCIPLVLAFVSWAYFPMFVQWLVGLIFGYQTLVWHGNWIWNAVVLFFYTWYTFLAIGVAGILTIAAASARLEKHEIKRMSYPLVSFVVPAYNEEKNVSRCLTSLFKCAERYGGQCEIIVVDDGSADCTYEVAWSALEANQKHPPNMRGKVVRHSANVGKVEAMRTGVDRALGDLIAVVDADSWWLPDALVRLVDHMLSNGKKAVTGYVHPSNGSLEPDNFVVLQQLEYSEGQGITRNAQSIGNNVVVVPGAIGVYDAQALRGILNEKSLRSVTEDLEIALEMHKRGAKIGYVSLATSQTEAPATFGMLWNQRLRWFTGWLHNTLDIHKDLLLKRSKLTLFLWYCYVIEYGGALIDAAALVAFPLLFWFAPDRTSFFLNLFVFVPYGLLLGIINQTIALKFAYNRHNYRSLLFYMPFYPILRLINVFARLTSSVKYVFGYRGSWHSERN